VMNGPIIGIRSVNEAPVPMDSVTLVALLL